MGSALARYQRETRHSLSVALTENSKLLKGKEKAETEASESKRELAALRKELASAKKELAGVAEEKKREYDRGLSQVINNMPRYIKEWWKRNGDSDPSMADVVKDWCRHRERQAAMTGVVKEWAANPKNADAMKDAVFDFIRSVHGNLALGEFIDNTYFTAIHHVKKRYPDLDVRALHSSNTRPEILPPPGKVGRYDRDYDKVAANLEEFLSTVGEEGIPDFFDPEEVAKMVEVSLADEADGEEVGDESIASEVDPTVLEAVNKSSTYSNPPQTDIPASEDVGKMKPPLPEQKRPPLKQSKLDALVKEKRGKSQEEEASPQREGRLEKEGRTGPHVKRTVSKPPRREGKGSSPPNDDTEVNP